MTFPILNRDSDTIRDWAPKLEQSLPTGASTFWFTNTAPTGWLICNGSAISRSVYADLFAVLGTTYGAGDGSTTFNLPDLRQRFPLGKAASGTGATLGATGGSIDHTHGVPAHYHGMGTGATLSVDINHDHGSFTSGAGSAHNHGITDSGHTHNIWTNTDVPGGGSARRGVAGTDVNNIAGMDSATTGITINNESAHTHSIDVPALGATAKTPTGSIGLVTGGVDGNASMTSGSNNPPFIAVNFIIKT